MTVNTKKNVLIDNQRRSAQIEHATELNNSDINGLFNPKLTFVICNILFLITVKYSNRSLRPFMAK